MLITVVIVCICLSMVYFKADGFIKPSKTYLTYHKFLHMAKPKNNNNENSNSKYNKINQKEINKKEVKKITPIRPEFSRLVNAAQVPAKRSVLCRIVAKENECKGLAKRFDISNITYFGANVTLSRRDSNSIDVSGTFEAHMQVAELVEPEILIESFDTLLLDNSQSLPGYGSVSFEDNMDYDDEIGSDGSIDIGEIAAQYFSLEM